MLEKEFQYYLDNQDDLVKIYNNKFIVIKNQTVINSFDSELDAFIVTSKEHEPGTFLIQYCEPGDESYTQSYHSRVVFN